ncbi:hypothetical protein ABK040_000246 [Willaertia magna]
MLGYLAFLSAVIIIIALPCYAYYYLWLKNIKPFFDAQVKLENSKIGQVSDKKKKGTCIIIGGSIGGITTALVASFHFENVIVFEKKRYEANKSTAPQGTQTHIFLRRCITIYTKLFGGHLNIDFINEIEKIGAFKILIENTDYAAIDGKSDKLCGLIEGQKICPPGYQMTRYMIESCIRDLIMNVDNGNNNNNQSNLGKIQFRDDQTVSGLIFETMKTSDSKIIHQVKGVKLDHGELIYGDLIIDCSGLTTQTPTWIEEEFSKETLSKEHISKENLSKENLSKNNRKRFTMEKSKIILTTTYTSAIYKLKDPENPNGFFLKDGKTPVWAYIGNIGFPTKSGMIYYRVAQDLGMFILGETGKNPECVKIKNHEDCIEFLSKVSPDISEKTKLFFENCDLDQGPVINWSNYKKDGTVLNHWEKTKFKDENGNLHLLENFLALGDSVGSLNPVYGQGVTCMTECQLILDEILRRENSKIDYKTFEEFQTRVYRIYIPPYILATMVDLQLEAKGGNWWYKTFLLPILGPNVKRTILSSKIDPFVRCQFNRIQGMCEGYLYEMFDKKYRARSKNPQPNW